MGVCDVVVQMADAVAAARQPLSSSESRWWQAIREISEYQLVQRLDLWEANCNVASPPEPSSPTEELLEEVQMLGLCNLYQAFDEQRTCEFYERLVPYFAQRGVIIPKLVDLTGW
jgi:hypothetical protein